MKGLWEYEIRHLSDILSQDNENEIGFQLVDDIKNDFTIYNDIISKDKTSDYFTLIDSPFIKEREYMKTDIREYGNKYIMEIDLPGLNKEDITINYENGYLTIKAIKNVELKTEVYVRRERFYGEIKRSFFIGEKKETDIKANYENGILSISFPKEEIPKKEGQNIIIK